MFWSKFKVMRYHYYLQLHAARDENRKPFDVARDQSMASPQKDLYPCISTHCMCMLLHICTFWSRQLLRVPGWSELFPCASKDTPTQNAMLISHAAHVFMLVSAARPQSVHERNVVILWEDRNALQSRSSWKHSPDIVVKTSILARTVSFLYCFSDEVDFRVGVLPSCCSCLCSCSSCRSWSTLSAICLNFMYTWIVYISTGQNSTVVSIAKLTSKSVNAMVIPI